jgi:hypothetical protein
VLKYDKYFLTEKNGIIQPGMNKAVVYPIVKADMGLLGPDFGIGWHPITKPFKMIDESHKHDYGQVLAFIPGDITKMGELDAEIEFYLDGEKHIITRTTVVHIPGGMIHCPLYINRVGKPFLFNNMYFTAEYIAEKVEKKIK